MNNKLYKLGTRKENWIKEQLIKEGYDIVQRTAGSHSPIDIIAINIKDRQILLIQSKRTLNMPMSYIDDRLKRTIEAEYINLNGLYNVIFNVR